MDIAERIKTVRGKLSQEEFSQQLGIHKNSLGRYERGDSTPGADVVERICTIFGVDPQWLLLGTGRMRGEVSQSAQIPNEEGIPLSTFEARIAALEEQNAQLQTWLREKDKTINALAAVVNSAYGTEKKLDMETEKPQFDVPGQPVSHPPPPHQTPTRK